MELFCSKLIFVVCLTAHLWHVLQPLDVSDFGSIKSNLEGNIHVASLQVSVLDAFIIARILRDSYEKSHAVSNIRSGFKNAGYGMKRLAEHPLSLSGLFRILLGTIWMM